jgi:hypothetical protein
MAVRIDFKSHSLQGFFFRFHLPPAALACPQQISTRGMLPQRKQAWKLVGTIIDTLPELSRISTGYFWGMPKHGDRVAGTERWIEAIQLYPLDHVDDIPTGR